MKPGAFEKKKKKVPPPNSRAHILVIITYFIFEKGKFIRKNHGNLEIWKKKKKTSEVELTFLFNLIFWGGVWLKYFEQFRL